MPSKRQLQVAEVLKRNFSYVLQQEGRFIYEDALVTVTNAAVTPDLSLAKVYLSVYNTENKQGVLLKLQEQQHRLQQLFHHRVRKHLRRTPLISLYLDDTLDEMDRLDQIFRKLDQKRGDDEE